MMGTTLEPTPLNRHHFTQTVVETNETSQLTVASAIPPSEGGNRSVTAPAAPPSPRLLTRAAICVTRAVGAPYLKIAGGALMIIGFCTSWMGFGVFLGVAGLGLLGAGLVVVSTAASCIDDVTKPTDKQEGLDNVLLKSAGWATPVGPLMLIPYWVRCCRDSDSSHEKDGQPPHDQLSSHSAVNTQFNSPNTVPSSVASPEGRQPNPNIWQPDISGMGSPSESNSLYPPSFSSPPTRLHLRNTDDDQNEISQSRAKDSSLPNPDEDHLIISSSQLDYSVSTSDHLTDVGPDEQMRNKKPEVQSVIHISTLVSPNLKPLSKVPTTRVDGDGVIEEWINDDQ